MNTMNDSESRRELERLQQQVADLEAEIKQQQPVTWSRDEVPFYPTYLAWSGAVLGMIGAVASLLVNVVGSLIINQHPLRLIQIYLTFPLGEKAIEDGGNMGIIMAVGCCLYVLTGAVLAIPLHLILVRFFPNANLKARLTFATIAGLLLWAVNFYLILATIQPTLIGGNWIVEKIPPWIAAVTHLVFAWVVAALAPWGTFSRNPAGFPADGNTSLDPNQAAPEQST